MSDAINILLVEDNPADVDLMVDTLESTRKESVIHVARDGVEALDFLFQRGPYRNAPEPQLVLLDLNLPRKDGREVLQEVKKDARLRRLPVVIFTSSTSRDDILKSYDLHVNAYVRKPVGLKGYRDVVRSLDDFWFRIVQRP